VLNKIIGNFGHRTSKLFNYPEIYLLAPPNSREIPPLELEIKIKLMNVVMVRLICLTRGFQLAAEVMGGNDDF